MNVAEHLTLGELKKTGRSEKREVVARRIRAIVLACEGQTSDAIATELGLSPRSVRFWVARYNEFGLEGLEDRPGRGRKKALTDAEERKLLKRIQTTGVDEQNVCKLSGAEVRKILAREFGIKRGLQAVYNLIHKLGLQVSQPKPRVAKTPSKNSKASQSAKTAKPKVKPKTKTKAKK